MTELLTAPPTEIASCWVQQVLKSIKKLPNTSNLKNSIPAFGSHFSYKKKHCISKNSTSYTIAGTHTGVCIGVELKVAKRCSIEYQDKMYGHYFCGLGGFK